MKCKDCIHFPVCCISANADSDYTDRCKQILLPTPKGKWITKPHVHGVTYCSKCDFELKIDDTNFCPNCGVDMRGEENG